MITVTISKPSVFNEYGIPFVNGQQYNLSDDFARGLISQQKATDTYGVLNSPVLLATTASGNTNVSSTVVTTNPGSISSRVTTAVLGQITYTGAGGFDSIGHNIGVYGYALMNAPGNTASLMIANEGKVTNIAGTLQNTTSFTAAFSDSGASTQTDNYVGYRSGGSNNNATAAVTNLSHFRADSIATGAIANALCFNAQDQTNYSAAAVGFYSQISAGANKYGLFCQGTAQNQMNGNLSLAQGLLPGNFTAIQTAVSVFAGTGVPSNANGADGNFFLRSDGGAGTTIYHKRAGAWVGIV